MRTPADIRALLSILALVSSVAVGSGGAYLLWGTGVALLVLGGYLLAVAILLGWDA